MQVVVCGEQTLRNAIRDALGPLFNFPNEIVLGPLQIQDVTKLVTIPMDARKIQLVEKDEIVKRIYEVSGGHPSVVQRLCSRLIERMNQHAIHRIELKDIEDVIADPNFRRVDFLDTYWQAASPLEKIISLLMAEDQTLTSANVIWDTLKGRFKLQLLKRDVDSALRYLVDLRSILEETPDGFKFKAKAFPQMVSKKSTLKDLLESSVEEYLNPQEKQDGN
jgi:hypothetical protein